MLQAIIVAGLIWASRSFVPDEAFLWFGGLQFALVAIALAVLNRGIVSALHTELAAPTGRAG